MHHRFGDAACEVQSKSVEMNGRRWHLLGTRPGQPPGLARYATVTVVLPRHTRGVRAAPVSDAIRVVSRKPHRIKAAMYLDPSAAQAAARRAGGGTAHRGGRVGGGGGARTAGVSSRVSAALSQSVRTTGSGLGADAHVLPVSERALASSPDHQRRRITVCGRAAAHECGKALQEGERGDIWGVLPALWCRPLLEVLWDLARFSSSTGAVCECLVGPTVTPPTERIILDPRRRIVSGSSWSCAPGGRACPAIGVGARTGRL